MDRGYLWLQLKVDLLRLTSVQMLGKIFVWTVYIHNTENLITRGAPIAQWQRRWIERVSANFRLGKKARYEHSKNRVAVESKFYFFTVKNPVTENPFNEGNLTFASKVGEEYLSVHIGNAVNLHSPALLNLKVPPMSPSKVLCTIEQEPLG